MLVTLPKSTEMYVIDVIGEMSFQRDSFRVIPINEGYGARRHSLAEGLVDLVASGVECENAQPIGGRSQGAANFGALNLPIMLTPQFDHDFGDGRHGRAVHPAE